MMAAYWLLVLGLSGAGGYLRAVHHDKLAMEPRAELARAARHAWDERMHVPLAIVAGDRKEARAVSFYGKGLVHYWDMFDPVTTPWLSETDVRRAGALFVCREDNAGCQSRAGAFSGVSPITVSVSKTVWGVAFPERRYVLFVMPPAGQSVMPVASPG